MYAPYAQRRWGLLSVPFSCSIIMQSRDCSVVGPTVWNCLPLVLHLLPIKLSSTFYNHLKTILSIFFEDSLKICYINPWMIEWDLDWTRLDLPGANTIPWFQQITMCVWPKNSHQVCPTRSWRAQFNQDNFISSIFSFFFLPQFIYSWPNCCRVLPSMPRLGPSAPITSPE